MPDTQKTYADLLADVFHDGQAAGSISASDIRDLIVSLAPAAGGMYMTGNATATTIAATDTWYKIAGTTIEDADPAFFDMTLNNRLVYDDTVARHMHVSGAFSITSTANNQVGEIALFKNGFIVDGSISEFKCLASGDAIPVPLSATVHMNDSDFMEAYILNETAINNMTVTYMNMHVLGVQHL